MTTLALALLACAPLAAHSLYTISPRGQGRDHFDPARDNLAFVARPSFPIGVCRNTWKRNADGFIYEYQQGTNCTRAALRSPGKHRVLAVAPLPPLTDQAGNKVADTMCAGRLPEERNGAYELECDVIRVPRNRTLCGVCGSRQQCSNPLGRVGDFVRVDYDAQVICAHRVADCSDEPRSACRSYTNWNAGLALDDAPLCDAAGVCACSRTLAVETRSRLGKSIPTCAGCYYDAERDLDRCPSAESSTELSSTDGIEQQCSPLALRKARQPCLAGGVSLRDRKAFLALIDALESDAEPVSDFGEACDYARDMLECLVEAHPAACGPLADTFDDDDICGADSRAKLEALGCDACDAVASAAARGAPLAATLALAVAAALLTNA